VALTKIITLESGEDGVNPEIYEDQCAYLNTPPSATLGCKQHDIHPKLSRFIVLITSTILAFFRPIALNQPNLLQNQVFSQECIQPFTVLIQALYYFVGRTLAVAFCHRLRRFVQDVNILFGAQPGAEMLARMDNDAKAALPLGNTSDSDILVETSAWRDYTCGRGIVQDRRHAHRRTKGGRNPSYCR